METVLPNADYADAFSRPITETATPEQWARAIFGDVPSPGARFIWHGVLRFRLSQGPSKETVAGWRIAERGPDWVRLETASWFMTANLLVKAADGQLTLSTHVRYERRIGRLIWTPLSAVHRRLAPGVLRDAKL